MGKERVPSLRKDEKGYYWHIEIEHAIVNIWWEMDPQMVEIIPDQGRAGEKDFQVQIGSDNVSYLTMKITEVEKDAED